MQTQTTKLIICLLYTSPPTTGRTRTASTVPAPGASSGKSSVPRKASDACARSMATQGEMACVSILSEGPRVT